MNPDIIHPIDENQLNQRYYFQSLTEQAVFAGLLTDSDMARIKASLFEILSEQTNLLTKGESSSIPAEKAQELLTSVVYTIGLRLKYFTSPEQAVDALKSVSLRKLFDEGLSEIRKSAVIARRIQKRINFSIPPMCITVQQLLTVLTAFSSFTNRSFLRKKYTLRQIIPYAAADLSLTELNLSADTCAA